MTSHCDRAEIRIPHLPDSAGLASILAWRKRHGERVEVGDDLLEVETDKISVVCSSDVAGFLDIRASAGQVVPLGALVAYVVASVDDVRM